MFVEWKKESKEGCDGFRSIAIAEQQKSAQPCTSIKTMTNTTRDRGERAKLAKVAKEYVHQERVSERLEA